MEDKLVFYKNSADAIPFKGINEEKYSTEPYDALESLYVNGNKDFRKTFSNFHVGRFTFEGRLYNSIEHAYHAKKFLLFLQYMDENPEFKDEFGYQRYKADVITEAARQLSLESNTELSIDPEKAKNAGNKITCSPGFFRNVWEREENGIRKKFVVLEDIARAKYHTRGVPEIEKARNVLMASAPAQLVYFIRSPTGGIFMRLTYLERIRDELTSQDEWQTIRKKLLAENHWPAVVKRARVETEVLAPPNPTVVAALLEISNHPNLLQVAKTPTAGPPHVVLRTDGVVVVRVMDMERVKAYEQQLLTMQWPEFVQGAEPPYAMGGFGAYGFASSFHHPMVRELRALVKHELTRQLFRFYAPGRRLESMFDRVCERKKTYGAINKELWHQDVCNVLLPDTDEIFGGWLNLDSNLAQKFICVLRSQHDEMHARPKGFERVADPTQRNLYDLKKVEVEVPPGCVILIRQGLVHTVNPSMPLHRSFRLFHGFRITDDLESVFNGNRKTRDGDLLTEKSIDWITNLSVPLLPSGEIAPIFARMHLNHYVEMIHAFAQKFKEAYRRQAQMERHPKNQEKFIYNYNTPSMQKTGKDGKPKESFMAFPLPSDLDVDLEPYFYSQADIDVLTPQLL